MAYLVAFLMAACVVLWTTPTVKAVGLRSGRIDKPNARKMHTRPMVRLGGVSIFLGYLVALLLLWSTGAFGTLPPEKEYEIWGVTVGGLLFFCIGLTDDLFDLPASWRLLAQSTVALAAWAVGVRIEFVTLPFIGLITFPAVLSAIVTLFWLVGLTNAINWMDGLDGLAAGVSGIAAVVLLMVSLLMNQPGAAIIAAALAGGALGFLRYNFNPAQIFMGDGGAYFLGFTLAGIGAIGVAKVATTLAIALPFCILAVPIVDMSAVMFNRIARGMSPFKADNRHLHHRLMRVGLSQRLAVLFVYALTLWMGSFALVLSGSPLGSAFLGGASVVMMAVGWEVWKRARRFANLRASSNGKANLPNAKPVTPSDPAESCSDLPPRS